MDKKNNNEPTDRAVEIQNLPARYITIGEHMDKKAAEDVVRGLPIVMTNINDGRKAQFPVGTIGKILLHRGFDLSRIIRNIPELYETSLLGWSEPEILKEGHKAHSNTKEYHHYVNKFTDGNGEYYVRFTVCEMKGYSYETRKNIIHSAAISDIVLYKKGADSQRIRLEVPGGASSTPFVDRKLHEFFDRHLKANSNNITDSEYKGKNRGDTFQAANTPKSQDQNAQDDLGATASTNTNIGNSAPKSKGKK